MSLKLLSGMRVLTLEQYIAGPYCTSILADLGAEVIKIERPGIGDPRRGYLPGLPNQTRSINAGYVPYNRGKKSLELDIRSAEGNRRFRDLLDTADVLVSNLRPGTLEEAGCDAASLRERFPRLVFCEITGFGATGGPLSSHPAFDSVVQAMSGLSGLIGDDETSPPGLAPMSTNDLLAGVYASVGILAGLLRRATSGEGLHVDAAMYDIGAAFLMRPLSIFEFSGAVPGRGQDDHSPVGAFQAGDGRWVSIVIPTDEMWNRTLSAVHDTTLSQDSRLATNEGRSAHMKAIILPALTSWAVDLTGDEAVSRLRAAGQPAGVVARIDEVRASEQLAERGLFVSIDGLEDTVKVPRLPLLFDGAGSAVSAIHELGADNDVT